MLAVVEVADLAEEARSGRNRVILERQSRGRPAERALDFDRLETEVHIGPKAVWLHAKEVWSLRHAEDGLLNVGTDL